MNRNERETLKVTLTNLVPRSCAWIIDVIFEQNQVSFFRFCSGDGTRVHRTSLVQKNVTSELSLAHPIRDHYFLQVLFRTRPVVIRRYVHQLWRTWKSVHIIRIDHRFKPWRQFTWFVMRSSRGSSSGQRRATRFPVRRIRGAGCGFRRPSFMYHGLFAGSQTSSGMSSMFPIADEFAAFWRMYRIRSTLFYFLLRSVRSFEWNTS